MIGVGLNRRRGLVLIEDHNEASIIAITWHPLCVKQNAAWNGRFMAWYDGIMVWVDHFILQYHAIFKLFLVRTYYLVWSSLGDEEYACPTLSTRIPPAYGFRYNRIWVFFLWNPGVNLRRICQLCTKNENTTQIIVNARYMLLFQFVSNFYFFSLFIFEVCY